MHPISWILYPKLVCQYLWQFENKLLRQMTGLKTPETVAQCNYFFFQIKACSESCMAIPPMATHLLLSYTSCTSWSEDESHDTFRYSILHLSCQDEQFIKIYYKISPFGMCHFPKNQQEESQNQPLYLQEILGFSTALLHENIQANSSRLN